MKNLHLNLFNTLMSMRTTASLLFDKGRTMGIPDEEIQKSISPLQEKFKQSVAKAHLLELITAVQSLDDLKGAHQERMKYLQGKIAECGHHQNTIVTEIIARMRAEKLEELQVGDFLMTLVTENGVPSLRIR